MVISGMTGGTPEAAAINRDLARAAETLGLGFGLGSQRAMVVAPDLGWTYRVRDVAPNALVMGNLGIVQARQMSTGAIRELCKEVGVDALCVHLTPVDGADPAGRRSRLPRRARDARAAARRARAADRASRRPAPGCRDASAWSAKQIGIRTVDTSGAGGTSWVGVETRRAEGSAQEARRGAVGLGHPDGGVGRAARRSRARHHRHRRAAQRQDVAHALALGATAGGLAAPVLRAHRDGGYDGVDRVPRARDRRRARGDVFLTGCRTPAELRTRAQGDRLDAARRGWSRRADACTARTAR